MALLGHHFSDVTSAPWTSRLRKLWSVKPHRPAPLQFKHTNSRNADAAACKTATEVYAGEMPLTADEFSSLVWLDVFARSGRHLLMCHALRLLQGWNGLHHPHTDVDTATAILDRLTAAAPDFAFHLNPALLGPLVDATRHQISRVQHAKAHSPTKILAKAQSLLRCSQVLHHASALQHDALHLLDHSVPYLILPDGGPSAHGLHAYVQWISPLLDADQLHFSPLTRNALDRAAPFLSMLVGADGHYCFDATLKPVASVAATPSLHIARQSGVGQAQAGKTVVILASHLHDTASKLFISSQGQCLCDSGLPDTEPRSVATCEYQQTAQGQLFEHSTSDIRRTVFLSPNGDDVRVEERFMGDLPQQTIRLTLNPQAKISIARNGAQATIALGTKNLWQLTLRGAVLQRQNDDHILNILATAQNVNWALKRIARTSTRGQKPDLPELPF